MRLIDADKLIEELIAYRNHTYQTSVYWAIDDAVDRVKEQLTAYDTNKMCEELCELFECSDECKSKFYYGLGCGACMWGDVLNIVKRGGING